MTEQSSGAPNDITTGDEVAPSSEPVAPESVELDIDQEKMEAWDEVKSDYQIEPDDKPVPNSMAPTDYEAVEDEAHDSAGD
jgi:hypothetical protein